MRKIMPVFKHICRICLQDADYQEVQEISLSKLNDLKNQALFSLPFSVKWDITLFRNHLICDTCINNFRTIETVHRQAFKGNKVIQRERIKYQLNKVNLKRLQRFTHIDGDFIVCRLCLEPTRQIAIYLYDNSKNILPVEYIIKMLKYAKIYTSFNATINPVLCHSCWQNIQISYSFCKHLELITEKVLYYQTLTGKIYLDQEDLQKMVDMWDQLVIGNFKTEKSLIFKKEIAPKVYNIKFTSEDFGEQLKLKESIADTRSECSVYNDHDYLKIDKEISSLHENKDEDNTFKLVKTTNINEYVEESSDEMPELTSSFENESPNEMPVLTPNFEARTFDKIIGNREIKSKTPVKEKQNENNLSLVINTGQQKQTYKSKTGKNNTIIITRKPNSQKTVNSKLREKFVNIKGKEKVRPVTTQTELNNSSYKDKLRSMKKDEKTTRPKKSKSKETIKTIAKKRKTNLAVQSKRKKRSTSPKTTELLTVDSPRPRTRLSTKPEFTDYPYFKDLLVLRKEEIVKKKPPSKKFNVSFPKHTSTPKLSKNTSKQNVSSQVNVNLPSKSNTNSDYTFDTFNLNEEVQVKKEIIEEDELQIKKEVVSECESDDPFVEDTGCNTNETESFDDECPNLDYFIKSEPPDDSYSMYEDEPPELDFQGPCNSVPVLAPSFTIQNTYTVDEKRHFLNLIDEKRNLLNLTNQEVDDTRSTAVVNTAADTKNKNNLIALQSNMPKLFNEKQDLPLEKVKQDSLQKIELPKIAEEGVRPEPDKMPDLVASITEFDTEANPTLPERPKNVRDPSSSNSNIEEINTNTREILYNLYSNIDKQVVNPEQPFSCYVCDFTSVSALGSKSHIFSHLTNSLHINKCEFCSFKSTKKANVTEHMKKEHPVERKQSVLKCEVCSFTSTKRIKVVEHMKKGHLQICQFCPFSSENVLQFRKHMEKLHGGKLLHKCLRCTFASVSPRQLLKHLQKRHKGKNEKIEKIDKRKKQEGDRSSKLYCDACEAAIEAKPKPCMVCKKVFHVRCFTKDKQEMKFNCHHQDVAEFMKNRKVTVEQVYHRNTPISFRCNSCNTLMRKWINCKRCDKSFHYRCFGKYLDTTPDCKHVDQDYLYSCRLATLPEIEEGRAKGNIEPTPCEFCQEPVMIRCVCPRCKKYMHTDCLEKHFKIDTKNLENITKSESEGKKTLSRQCTPEKICEYCNKALFETCTNITCLKCNRTMHQNCFDEDRVKNTLGCEHFSLRLLRRPASRAQIKKDISEGGRDQQSIVTNSEDPTTSKEVKQEMINEFQHH